MVVIVAVVVVRTRCWRRVLRGGRSGGGESHHERHDGCDQRPGMRKT
jgi:hypothetical protein